MIAAAAAAACARRDRSERCIKGRRSGFDALQFTATRHGVLRIPDAMAAGLRTQTNLTPSGRFDFIKLDVEGEELHLLGEAETRAQLCAARCIFMEVHEWFVPGSEGAYRKFLADGCADGTRFVEIAETGEYFLACQEALVQARDAAAVAAGGEAIKPTHVMARSDGMTVSAGRRLRLR